MKPESQNWIAAAEYDLETARHMLATGRFIYVVFMCHLALEKILKAHVAEVTKEPPAKTHDLIYLVKKARLELPQEELEFIGLINNASIPTRYPEDIRRVIKDYPEAVVRDYFEKTQAVMRWLRQHPSLKK